MVRTTVLKHLVKLKIMIVGFIMLCSVSPQYTWLTLTGRVQSL